MTPPLSAAGRCLGTLGVVVSISLLATGCQMNNPYKPTDPTEASKAATSLSSLPSLEDTKIQVDAAIAELGKQITALVPSVTWNWSDEDSRGGCHPPYEQSDGEQILLRNYLSAAPIPEQDWKQAYDLAKKTADSLGATHATTFKDAPNDHDVQFSSSTGTVLRFGSKASALITGSTGCRLPAVKHR